MELEQQRNVKEEYIYKFKAYVHELDRIFPVHAIDFYKEEVTVFHEETKRQFIFPLNYVELLQHTNHKDCNGREIYEGDIIEYENGNCGYGRPREQELSKHLVPHLPKIDDEHQWAWVKDGWYVGNKYETPNLLKYCSNYEDE